MAKSALGYSRFRKRVLCIDDLFSLDIRQWNKDQVLDCNLFEYHWQRNQQAIGRIYLQLCDATDTVSYTLEMKGVAKRNGQLSLVRTRCHYGGERFWFECPCCKRKAAKLYFHDRSFQCHRCCALPYKCQNETASDRNIRRVRSVRRLLGASDNILEPITSKPLGMHWDRFGRLLNKTEQLDSIVSMWGTVTEGD